MGRAGKWIAFSPFLLLTAKRGSVTRFLTLGGEFGFRCLLCGCVIAKGGRGWLAKVLKRECLEKKKKKSEAFKWLAGGPGKPARWPMHWCLQQAGGCQIPGAFSPSAVFQGTQKAFENALIHSETTPDILSVAGRKGRDLAPGTDPKQLLSELSLLHAACTVLSVSEEQGEGEGCRSSQLPRFLSLFLSSFLSLSLCLFLFSFQSLFPIGTKIMSCLWATYMVYNLHPINRSPLLTYVYI